MRLNETIAMCCSPIEMLECLCLEPNNESLYGDSKISGINRALYKRVSVGAVWEEEVVPALVVLHHIKEANMVLFFFQGFVHLQIDKVPKCVTRTAILFLLSDK